MGLERGVQVVLGEAEPDAGILRFVLEGEGFDIVGLASTDDELARVLRGARPAVIVLDAGISAIAAVEAKERAKGAALVVIWPDGVTASIADERVEPHLVIDELGAAVRSASRKARPQEPRLHIPDTIEEVIGEWRAAEAVLAPPAPVEERPEPMLDRSGRGVLVVAATWILILTTLATIAVGVPNAFEVFGHRQARPPLLGTSVDRTSGSGQVARRESTGSRADGTPTGHGCGATVDKAERTKSDRAKTERGRSEVCGRSGGNAEVAKKADRTAHEHGARPAGAGHGRKDGSGTHTKDGSGTHTRSNSGGAGGAEKKMIGTR